MSRSTDIVQSVGRWLNEAGEVLRAVDPAALAKAADALCEVRARGGVIYTAGNGGSAAAASHLALDLQKAARDSDGHRTRALCLSDSVGLITAWGNDTTFEHVFSEQLDVLAKAGDGLAVISVSGSSPNLMALLEVARKKKVLSVGLLGCDGGRALELVDVPVVVRSSDYGWVESVHVVMHHVLTYALRDAAFAGSPPRVTRTA